MRKKLFLVLGLLCGASILTAQNVVDFEELSLEPESHWNGSDGSGQFSSAYLKFYNSFTDWGGGAFSWDGFAYTNETDESTFSFTNDYSSASGQGVWGSQNYAVSYIMGDWMNDYEPIPSKIKLNPETMPEEISGMFISLNTYSSLYMADNNFYSSGSHWLKLHIVAYNTTSWYATNADVMLSDYRFENSELDYKITDWTYVDLTWAEGTDSLLFYIYSSDIGEYGTNTPTYFCIDNFGEDCPTGIPQLQTEIKTDYYINSEESVQISALACGGVQPYKFEWSSEIGLDDYHSQTPLAEPTSNTTWTVTVTDALGNEKIGTVNVWVDATKNVQNKEFESDIYINSANNLIIESDKVLKEINIFDISGKLLISKIGDSTQLSIDISNLSSGIYIVNLSDGASVISKKIVK